MSKPENVKRAARQERRLIAAEEKAARLLLDARSKHERALKKVAKAEQAARSTADSLVEAETSLAAARSARATGP
jgi:hypothetical protein